MIHFLAKHFIKDYQNTSDQAVRRAYGILCGFVGIALNLLLFAGKLLAGILSGSIAVTADAVNNLSDAGSSVVTLLGFKLAAQAPDRDHPFGHGRWEYVSGLVVSMVILLMGVELGKTSVEKILAPEPVDFSPLVAVILGISIAVKLYMAYYNRTAGKKLSSAAMSATALDSLSDCLATSTVLLGTLAGHFWNVQIDGWCGAAVALFILWSGFGAARDTVNPLLGQPPSPEFVEQIRVLVRSHPEIIGSSMLTVYPGSRLWEERRTGSWTEAGELEKLRELRTLIGSLTIPVYFATLGESNGVFVEGPLPEAREKMLGELDAVLARGEKGESALKAYRNSLIQ